LFAACWGGQGTLPVLVKNVMCLNQLIRSIF
jgi:hypothetical protein